MGFKGGFLYLIRCMICVFVHGHRSAESAPFWRTMSSILVLCGGYVGHCQVCGTADHFHISKACKLQNSLIYAKVQLRLQNISSAALTPPDIKKGKT